MDRVVKVSSGFRLNEYKSMIEATIASKRSNSLNKSKCELINGKIVSGYQFNGVELVMNFENKNHLIVSPGVKSINWDVLQVKPAIKQELEPKNIYFEFSNGVKVAWDWKNILNGFIGKEVAISPSDQFLFIFSRDGVEYMFSSLVNNENSSEVFLNISEA